jgi:hypothetical protein
MEKPPWAIVAPKYSKGAHLWDEQYHSRLSTPRLQNAGKVTAFLTSLPQIGDECLSNASPKRDEAERAHLMAGFDAANFHLYGIDRDDAVSILLATQRALRDPGLRHQSPSA